jgi:predicted Zn-dependent protease
MTGPTRTAVPAARRPPRPLAVLGLLISAALAAGGCMPPPEGDGRGGGGGGGAGEGPGHRQQVLQLSPEEELSLGRQAYKEILNKYRGRVLPGGPEVERCRDVARHVVKAAQIEPLQREVNYHMRGYLWEWEVNVIDDKQVNAFCLPAGKIGVFTGLLRVVDNRSEKEADSELATVLSHEIAHALAHHSNERITQQKMQEQALRAAGGFLGRMDPRHTGMLIKLMGGVSNFRGLSYSRELESEADHIGVFLMTFAGYDPDAAVRFWERMARAMQGQHPPEIFSDHPSDEHRIAQMQRWVPAAKAGKRAYDEGRIAPAPR